MTADDAELRRSAELLRTSDVMTSLFAPDGSLLLQNDAARAAFGNEQTGSGVFVRRFASSIVGYDVLRRLRDGERVHGEHEIITREGLRRHALLGRSVHDPVTRGTALVIELRDVTEDRVATDALRVSERRFRNMCNELPIAIFQSNLDGACSFVNQRWTELAGLSAGEALGYGFASALHPEDRARVLDEWRLIVAGKLAGTINHRYLTRQRVAWVSCTIVPRVDSNGEHLGFVGSIIDLTERVQSEQRFALVFEQSSDAHLLLDDKLEIRDCNYSALKLLGAGNKSALLGKTPLGISPAFQPDGRPSADAVQAVRAQLLASGAARFEWTYQRLDGNPVHAEVTVTRMMLDGAPTMFTSIRDTTERKREQESILRSREAALEASRVKSQFLANMSHEIRTPMHGVLGMLSLALSTDLTPEQLEFIGSARASAESLLEIINDILDLSKLEAGRLSIDSLDVELEPLLVAAFRTTALRAHAKGIEVSVDVAAEVPHVFTGDAVRLRQILINLLGNAVKFTEVGHILVSVTVEGTEEKPMLRFSVTDTGVGISAERQRAVFDAFEQADSSATRRHGGTGLGLTISKELVTRMGGRLDLSSTEGKGSTFSFEIPLVAVEAEASGERVDLSGCCVMVLHTNAVTRNVLAKAFMQRGARVLLADSVEQAVELASAEENVDAVFADHRLNDAHDVMEVPALLRQQPSCLEARYVLLRSHERLGRSVLHKAGFSQALDKPVLPSDIDRALTEALDQSLPSNRFALIPERSASEKKRFALSILVVEDHPVNAHFMTSLLTRWGHHVVHAWNGESALAALPNSNFDAILMDVQMPVMDGLETTRRIRASEADSGAHIPIVAMTAGAMKGDDEACLAAGMDYYMAKPIDIETLERLLARVARLRGKASARIVLPEATAKPAREPEQQPFAREALLARACGDPRFQADLIRIFVGSQDEMVSDVERAVSANDAHLVRHSAHRLKGGLQLVCAEPAAAVALELERAAREGRNVLFESLLESLRHEMQRLRAALGDFGSGST